jgi:hypothetical protein
MQAQQKMLYEHRTNIKYDTYMINYTAFTKFIILVILSLTQHSINSAGPVLKHRNKII